MISTSPSCLVRTVRKGSYFFERAAGEAEFYSEWLVTLSHTMKANTQCTVLVERCLEGVTETLSGISSVSFKRLLGAAWSLLPHEDRARDATEAPEKKPSSDTESVWICTLEFPASRTVSHQFLLSINYLV